MIIFNKYSGYQPDGGRLYGKGGDGGAGAAREAEENRQRRIAEAVSTINNIFSNPERNTLYDEQKQVVYDINEQDLNRQYANAERNNRFGLARFGLMGGSVDIDSNSELQRKTNEGLMRATGIAEDAASNLKMADERSKQSLISLAQSGIDTGTAQSMALQSLDAQAQSALGARAGAALGNIFGSLNQAYLNGKLNTGGQAALAGYQDDAVGNSTRSSYGGSTSS